MKIVATTPDGRRASAHSTRIVLKGHENTSQQPSERSTLKMMITQGKQTSLAFHPEAHRHSRLALEGKREGAVTAVAAVGCQLQGGEIPTIGNGLTVEIHEMLNAQIVDVGVVRRVLTGEILAEIRAVGANQLGQLYQRQVVLQIEMGVDASLLQQKTDGIVVGGSELATLQKLVDCRLFLSGEGLRLLDAQVAQRLYAPQEKTYHDDVEHLNDVFVPPNPQSEHIEAEQRQDEGHDQVALPQLLVLQVDKVVAQPAAVASDLADEIDD